MLKRPSLRIIRHSVMQGLRKKAILDIKYFCAFGNLIHLIFAGGIHYACCIQRVEIGV
jgi:hypothetical protein